MEDFLRFHLYSRESLIRLISEYDHFNISKY